MELNESEIKQAKFIESLTEDERILMEEFTMPSRTTEDDIKNYLTCNVDGWQVVRNTDKSFSVKLMLGYKTKSKPRQTNSIKIQSWEEVINFKDIMELIINKARQDIDNTSDRLSFLKNSK